MIHVLSVKYLLTLCFHQTFFSLKIQFGISSLFCRAINGKEIIGFKLTIKLIVKFLYNRNEQTLCRITECYKTKYFRNKKIGSDI